MLPLVMLLASLVVNYIQHKRGKSTICSTTRPLIPIPVFLAGVGTFLAWFVPHWIRPKLGRRRAP